MEISRGSKWCILALATLALADPRLVRTYHDKQAGLVIHYPGDWTLETSEDGFDIVSFRPRLRPPQVVVPLDGAEIKISLVPQNIRSVADWLRIGRLGPSNGDQVSEITINTVHAGVIPLTVVQCGLRGSMPNELVIPEGSLTRYLFPVQGRLVQASLLFRGKRHAAHFDGVMRSVLSNIEPEAIPENPHP
jgi:hypothetical protein